MIQVLNTRHFEHISRYTRNRQIYNNANDKIYLETSNQYKIQLQQNPVYHVVDINEENRLDIIANNYYGDPSLYWVIAMANNIIDPFVVNINTLLVIPYIEDLFNEDGPLSISDF